jgi:glutathionylspermidine synthase
LKNRLASEAAIALIVPEDELLREQINVQLLADAVEGVGIQRDRHAVRMVGLGAEGSI